MLASVTRTLNADGSVILYVIMPTPLITTGYWFAPLRRRTSFAKSVQLSGRPEGMLRGFRDYTGDGVHALVIDHGASRGSIVSDGMDALRRHQCAKVAGVETPLQRRASALMM